METTSFSTGLSGEKATEIMKNLNYNLRYDITVNSISKKKTGYGHYELCVEIGFGKYDSVSYKRTTTDMQIPDNWYNDLYSEEDPELGSSQQIAFSFVMSEEDTIVDLENIVNKCYEGKLEE
jgi:hypothetical protein